MCLILVSFKSHPSLPLVIAANRDEFYARETAPMQWHEKGPFVLCGTDLKEGGTWMGITKRGRFAALTNHRDPSRINPKAASRGWIVSRFLEGDEEPQAFADTLRREKDHYNGFNLLFGTVDRLYHYSNISDALTELSPGIHGMSNALLNTPWPKVETGRNKLGQLAPPTAENLFSLLADRTPPDDDLLPETGMGLEWERLLAPLFIQSEVYGTRSSCLITLDTHRTLTATERTYTGFDTGPDDIKEDRRFQFSV
ncbi:NRDE family protein [Desulfoluna sp.]|uniref:NRDE family protein n=1 Tax=Desulfoluna sp. TaxID=2045199 RepID=UPI00261A926B|nr:NRDE family protein [Desulfoluna sp.]